MPVVLSGINYTGCPCPSFGHTLSIYSIGRANKKMPYKNISLKALLKSCNKKKKKKKINKMGGNERTLLQCNAWTGQECSTGNKRKLQIVINSVFYRCQSYIDRNDEHFKMEL